MQCISAASLHRKSGQWGTQRLLPVQEAGIQPLLTAKSSEHREPEGKISGIPHLAKNERDMGHPSIGYRERETASRDDKGEGGFPLGGRHAVSGNFALGSAVRKNQAEYRAAGRGSALTANVNEASVLLYNIGRDP